jgi:hypothetical protein
MLIYTHSRSKRRKPSAKALRLRDERKAFFASVLNGRKGSHNDTMPDLKVENKSRVAALSNAIPANGFKRSVDDWRWKRDRQESAETVKEIERKKTQIAPAYNKGPVMFISEQMDPSSLGRKV